MRAVLLLALVGCVTPIDAVEHEAALDADRDGHLSKKLGGSDCDDGDPGVNPGQPEWCNGIDDDCDGVVDGPFARGLRPFWLDEDGDGAGSTLVWACEAPEGAVSVDGDCDDGNGAVGPGVAGELCNGVDDDCDGLIDGADPDVEALVEVYPDEDSDGYGAPGGVVWGCGAVGGMIEVAGDCDDADPAVHPGAMEHCDGVDEDCDGTEDEDPVDPGSWWPDADGDGHGAAGAATVACVGPIGMVENHDDCDDRDPDVAPGATEVCNRKDDDCDFGVDEDLATSTWYGDRDGDGWGTGAFTVEACGPPPGYVADDTDCDDQDGAVSPGALEVCGNGVDEDCDGQGCVVAGELWAADRSRSFAGSGGVDRLGSAIGAGDLDGDGTIDLVLGAPATGSGAGAVRVFSGPVGPGAWRETDATASVVGTGDGALGQALAVGDLTGDGVDDLVATAPEDDTAATDAGAVFLFAGPLTGTLDPSSAVGAIRGEVANQFIADDVAIGLLDAGPTPDLVLGATTDGAVSVFFDYAGGDRTVGQADVRIVGSPSIDWVGESVAVLGDVTGDGTEDLGFTAPGANYVALFAGPFTAQSVAATSGDVQVDGAAATVGTEVAAAGDLDGDGVADWLVSGRGDTNIGGVWVIPGGASTASGAVDSVASSVVWGLAPVDGTGSAMQSADLDGDGLDDLVVGAPGAPDPGATGAGGVFLFFGPVTGSRDLSAADAWMWSGTAADGLGDELAAADWTGDGVDDLAAGTFDPLGVGAVFLLAGEGP